MNLKRILLFIIASTSTSVVAEQTESNDVYGVVSEIIVRTDVNNDSAIYFRIDSTNYDASYAHCVADKTSLTWHLDLDSPVSLQQYNLLKESYKEQLPLRVIGRVNNCDNQTIDSDTVFEISPWSWPNILAERAATKQTQPE